MQQDTHSWRVDPFVITDFNRDDDQLAALFVFCCCVAGKKATMISRMVHEFLTDCGYTGGPIQRLTSMAADGTLDANLRRARLGKYALLTRCFETMVSDPTFNLRTSQPADLERLPGVGHKTSRFFVLHSRPNARVAVIDTHILKYLRAIGAESVPDSIPTGKHYLRLEKIMLAEADRLEMDMADFDLKIWSWHASKKEGQPIFGSGIHA